MNPLHELGHLSFPIEFCLNQQYMSFARSGNRNTAKNDGDLFESVGA